MEQDYDQTNFKGNEFYFDIYAHTLLNDPTSGIASPSIVGIVCLDRRLIRYIMNHVFFPRKTNFSTIQKSDIPAVWFLENQVEKNWVDVILHHTLDRNK